MINRLAIQSLKQYKGKVIALASISALGSVAVVGQAWFFANLINNFIFSYHSIEAEYNTILYLCITIVLRLFFQYSQERVANTLAYATKVDMRNALLHHMFEQGVHRKEMHGDMVHLLTHGLDQVESYIARYIPQILFAAIIPLIMDFAIIDSVPWIGVILLLTVPLIPFFMILIGKQAEKMNQEQWERMSFLSGHFLDMLQGLTTLKVFGRSKEQISIIGRLSLEFKNSTLRVLRVAFLSALVLELVSTISTALIAVYLGITLLYDGIQFLPAFFILLLAPEFYTPFRQLGAAFHTGMAGQASLLKIGEFLNETGQLHKGGTGTIDEPIRSIHCKDLTFTYGRGSGGVYDMNFHVITGDRIMFVGESGAGKSTMAHLIGGFLEPKENTLFINDQDICSLHMEWWRDQVVYVSQKPHILKGTLRDVISFGANVTDEEIIEACKAAEIYELVLSKPGHLDYMVAEGGVGLSGGEKQRIAIARAFLRKGQVLILDEVTAHLDVKTEESLSRALQRLMDGKIVILIGHRLQTMTWANTLYVLKGGRLVESGSYEDLVREKGYFYDLVQAGAGRFVEALDPNWSGEVQDKSNKANDSNETYKSRETNKNGNITFPSETSTTSMIKETQSGWKLLFAVLSPAKWSLLLAFIFSFLTVFMNVGLLSTSAWLLATAALHPELHYLSISIVGVRFFGISRAVCRYLERYTSHHMAFQGLYGLRLWFYKTLEPLGPAIFKRFGAGDLLGRIMADIEVLQFFYLRVLIPPVVAILLTLLVMGGISYVGMPLLLPVVVAFIIGGIVIPLAIYGYNKRSLQDISHYQGAVQAQVADVLEGVEDIIAYGQQGRTLKGLQNQFYDIEQCKHRINEGTTRGTITFQGLVQCTVVVSAYLATYFVTDLWNRVMIAVVAIGVQAWFESLQPMIIAAHHGYESKVAIQRLEVIGNEPLPITEPTNAVHTVNIAGNLQWNHVSFSYDTADLNTSVYKDLSFTIPAGTSVAIVGASGSGKTTLFNILERFYDYQGSITIGGEELKEIAVQDWRKELGVLTQDTYIFHASLEDNIRIANPHVSDQELYKAIIWANLDVVVSKLEEGLQTVVGNGGVGLSGGERQRVALARLYLRQSPILLLDEPLEGLDQVTRNAIHKKLMTFIKGKTTLYITHHLEGIDQMDRIIFMDKGGIIEIGTYDELIKKKGQFWEYCSLSMARI